MKLQLDIEGMSCQHCVKHVTTALQDIDGVRNVSVDLKKKTAQIESDAELSESVIRTAIEDAGYELTGVSGC